VSWPAPRVKKKALRTKREGGKEKGTRSPDLPSVCREGEVRRDLFFPLIEWGKEVVTWERRKEGGDTSLPRAL